MTVVHTGEAIKNAYRKFNIRTATNDDVAALKEVLERRLNHPEWQLPRVFVVDGGAAQLNVARKVLRQKGIEVPLVGVVKNEFHKAERLIGDRRAIEAYEKDILLANAEAHRFAITWHRKRRRASAFSS
jgi:excinuclease ABC subunit C